MNHSSNNYNRSTKADNPERVGDSITPIDQQEKVSSEVIHTHTIFTSHAYTSLKLKLFIPTLSRIALEL